MITGRMDWSINTDELLLFDEISPNAGDPLCLCSKCGQVIGAPDDDPRWDTHDEDACAGCDICAPPIRLWKTRDTGECALFIIGEYRFHKSCFEQLSARGMVQ